MSEASPERIRGLAARPHYHWKSGGGVDVQPITLLMNSHPEWKK
jgi:hypothetical protein